jgi:tetratricopeptide (TPR) repeat protein
MKKRFFIAILSMYSSILAMAQTTAPSQEDLSVGSVPQGLSGLQLDSTRQAALEDAIKQKDYKRAETILVEETEHDPKSIRTAKLLEIAGGLFFLDGQYLNSAIAWKKAESIAPLDDRSKFSLAMAYIKLDRRNWARPELEKLSVAQPRNSLYLYWLARLDYDAQNYNPAIARLQKVVEFDPSMMRAYDLVGLCYDYLGQFTEAINNYNRAVELNHQQSKPSPWPHVNLAISLISVNRLPEAEKNLREALQYDAQLPQAHYQLGRVSEMQGEQKAALQSLNKAAELDPSYAEPHYLLGRIYQKLGKRELANAEIAKFHELKNNVETQPKSQQPIQETK